MAESNLANDAWEELSVFYLATAPLAFRIAQRSARSRQDAEDAVHDAYLQVAAKWAAQWRDCSHERRVGRLRIILAHVIADLYRRKYFSGEVLTGEPLDHWPWTVNTQAPEARDLDAAAAFRQVCRVIASMPSRRRDVATLHWLAGFEREEVAEALGISPVTVRVHLRDARMDLERSDAGPLARAALGQTRLTAQTVHSSAVMGSREETT